MEDVRLIVDIVIALGAATVGGLIAQRLGLPALIGYILAGLVIGPNTPGLVADLDRVQLLANLGVALLMFGLGVEFSLSEVFRVRRAALLGGAIQIPLTVVLGTAAGLAGGWTLGSALDRKSTRLNSSHQIISYAVFCLKEKTIANLQVLDELDIPEAFALGTSQGGWIAARMAILAPGKVKGIIPLGTSMDF